MAAVDLWRDVYPTMLGGTWTPRAGSIFATRLLDGSPTPADLRLVRRFARLAMLSEGPWWLIALNSPVEALSDPDVRWVMATWFEWLDGVRVFRRRRRP